MRLASAVYALTRHFPDDEKSGLSATLKRSAAALPTRLAESHQAADPDGSARAIDGAQTALRELGAYLDVAQRLRMTSRWRFRAARRQADKLADRLGAMVDRLSEADAERIS